MYKKAAALKRITVILNKSCTFAPSAQWYFILLPWLAAYTDSLIGWLFLQRK